MSSYFLQKTLLKKVCVSGKGVHSGKKANLTIKPAPENHSIKFRRIDTQGTQDIPALFKMVIDTSLATVIGSNGAIVSTIEHLMACFAGLGIDNALVEIDDYEVPIMDGSAGVFTELIKESGIVEQSLPKHFLIVKKKIQTTEKDKSVTIYPMPCFKITCYIDFNHPVVGKQTISFDPTTDNFEEKISKARTFGFLKDLKLLKKYSLGKGGSLENAIIVDKEKILNKEGLRYPDEFVRHKLLDTLGDFSLLGMPIQGHIVTKKSGHALNHLFIKKILQNKNLWETGPVLAK